ncbi:1-acyl-sn-glycerol-3-phosphate acyltransferase [Allopontixanthobacter sp.]|uniref:1-acyl-sn-glycerol-3-phosphate acyltransferase n=1 Tax=Allopontixanthobacter sp. TaxID=2906452 RepID=UPI002AB9A4ED|nr:1-acyl-sn-glycerol-3-phosphate acyltransferase [Allopontixanthobacter sp.]MDZ4308552.1 1-acyl-sn-glycerol-3-phosphate acyltransferase [Allopontixanthobacter sp.]
MALTPHLRGDRVPSLLSRAVRRIILWLYRWKGWKLDGNLPPIAKYVIAGAPHSSNWDFVFFVGATAEQGVQPNFMGKNTLFRWPMTRFMLDMGGIPVDRSKSANYVAQVAAEFAARDRLALVIAAEGTRSSKGEWRSGFYHIAVASGVPIVPAWVCNERMILGFGPPIMPTGDYAADLTKIAAFMRSKLPDYGRYKVLEAQAARLMEARNG